MTEIPKNFQTAFGSNVIGGNVKIGHITQNINLFSSQLEGSSAKALAQRA